MDDHQTESTEVKPKCECAPRQHEKWRCGILAYGSLISDPGEEIARRVTQRLKTMTPFPVEYARYSGKTRGGAPTVVRHERGTPVTAEILVLDNAVTLAEARDMLWRRERRRVGSGETYAEGTTRDSVLVRVIEDNPCVSAVLYTDFPLIGKEAAPTAADLATRSIGSVKKAEPGMDGISYLIACLKAGIRTPLTDAYCCAILQQTNTTSLDAALAVAQRRTGIGE